MAEDLLCLFTQGISASDGDERIFRKGVALFSRYVSDDMEVCINYAIDKGVAVWDFYKDHRMPEYEWSSQINDLWVTFLCRQAEIDQANIRETLG